MSRPLILILTFLALAPAVVAERVAGRYIVELTGEPGAGHRARTHAEQQTMRGRLEQRSAQVLDRVDTVANALFVQISEEGAAQLASLPGVKRVVPVRKLHMVLDRGVILHKVVEAWNQVGSERAGAGVKIAIIDSGIQLEHPAFRTPHSPCPTPSLAPTPTPIWLSPTIRSSWRGAT